MKKVWITIMIVGVLFSVGRAVEPSGKDLLDEIHRRSLAGLEGIRVLIDIVGAEQHGLTKDELRVITELGLRRNGIKVLTEEEWVNAGCGPYLCVDVTVVGSSNAKAAMISVELLQSVLLERDPTILCVSVATWEMTNILLVSGDGVTVTVFDASAKEMLGEFVDEFCNDYLAANPIERPVQPKVNESEGEK